MKNPHKYETLGQILATLRTKRGILSQADLARQLDVSQQTISRWEAGISRPRAGELAGLAAILEVAPAHLARQAGYAEESTTISFDRLLPLPSLLPESFEYFCLDFLATRLNGLASVHPAGKTGHAQRGIDISAQFESGELHTFQCKREAQFGPAKVRAAIKAQSIEAAKKHILLSRVASPDARAAIRRHQSWLLWDLVDITRIFRELPKHHQVRIVDIYFPGQRYALTGEHSSGPWLSVHDFFAPQLIESRVFNQGWELVGRQTELEQLAKAFQEADTLGVCLIGRAGEGKSRLLRSALAEFGASHPESQIVVASPTEEITQKDLEDLGTGPTLIVADDVHDRGDLETLIRHAAKATSSARLLLVYRPYWDAIVKSQLAQYGLTGKLIRKLSLSRPTKQDAIDLATQVLTKHGGPADAAAMIAALAYDSPLAIVVGAQVVAAEQIHPQLLGSSETFQSTVLKRYENVIAQSVAQGKDLERVHAILRILALVQPVTPDDRTVLELINAVEGIDSPDSSRLIRSLVDAGALFKRGAKYRLSPDLLADVIIESACITQRGESNGYADRVFSIALSEHQQNILLNLGRLDWRRNGGDTSASRLLNDIWKSLRWEDDYIQAHVKAAAAVSYFQPSQALDFARRLLSEGHSRSEDVWKTVLGASYHLSHLREACQLFWQAGHLDPRQTNPHPYHPLRLLTELATPDPRKPFEFLRGVVDFALSLLDYPESWTGSYTPYDIIRGALTAEGHYTSSATSRALTLSKYVVLQDRVVDIRNSIIDATLDELLSSNSRRAFLAASFLSDALRGPMAGPSHEPDPWGDEFVSTLQRVRALLGKQYCPSPVLVRIAQSVHWHAFYGPDRTRSLSQGIIRLLDRDLSTKTIRALMDAWGVETFEIDAMPGRPKHAEFADRLCVELEEQFPLPCDLLSFLHDRLNEIHAVGSREPASSQFLSKILRRNIPLAELIVSSYLDGAQSNLTPHTGAALSVLILVSRAAGESAVAKLLNPSSSSIVAAAYSLSSLATYGEFDISALRSLFASNDEGVIRYLPHIARNVTAVDKSLAIELVTSVNWTLTLRFAPDLFMSIGQVATLPIELFSDAQLSAIVAGLREAPDLNEYWIHEFLKKALRRVPLVVIKLAFLRINDAILNEDWGKRPLTLAVDDRLALDLMSLPDGKALLKSILDSSLNRVEDYPYISRISELIQSLCRPYRAAFCAAVESWLEHGTKEHFRVLCSILREADHRFIYENEQFVAHVLKASRKVGASAHQELTTALLWGSWSGPRSGAPGEPFPFDVELKNMAQSRLTTITGSDAAFDLYTQLQNHAESGIDKQLAEGRLMAEADEDR